VTQSRDIADHPATDSLPPGVRRVTLLDGAVVDVRRLKKSDLGAVVALHRELTDREQYLRFFVAHPPYIETFAKAVVRRTAANYAVGAFEGNALIGIAHYVRSEEPAVAELAVAVAHQDHLRGVATALLRHLGDVALRNGIRYFAADVLADNGLMLDVLRHVGWRTTKTFDGPVLHVRIDLSGMTGRTTTPSTEGSAQPRGSHRPLG
jgi:GNAT superfamily N-acetyltransferase